MTLYAGENDIMGYAAEKMALAIFFSISGLYLTRRRVHLNKKFKSLILLVGAMLIYVIYSYLHSYAPRVTYPYLVRFAFVFAFVLICYDTRYLLKLCDYLQNFGVFIAVAYIVTWPIMGHRCIACYKLYFKHPDNPLTKKERLKQFSDFLDITDVKNAIQKTSIFNLSMGKKQRYEYGIYIVLMKKRKLKILLSL